MSSMCKFYQSFPKWREVRDNLVREVHGDSIEILALEPQNNKVTSREKFGCKTLLTKRQLDDQKFHDFLLACDGFNTVSFVYDTEGFKWTFQTKTFSLPTDEMSNNNLEKKFNEFDDYAAELLTKIYNIKCYLTQFQGDAQFGRSILILADEIDRFMSGEFKNMLIKLYEKPDVTKTSMQSIHLTFSEPINLMEKFLSNINASCAVGGFLLNLIKKERDALDRCYQSFFHDILIRSYKRGMEFYMQILVDWMNGNELDADLFYEFFIWDTSKRRSSSVLGQPKSLIVGFDELIYLDTFNPANSNNLIDVKTFKRNYLVVPELCPVDFGESLRQNIVKIGLYNHVLMSEDQDAFNSEFKKTSIEQPGFENMSKLPSLVKSRYRHAGRVILRHLCNQLEFTILMEKLPIYFCGIKNSVIDDFVELTENFNWAGLSRHQSVKLSQLNRLYQRAIELSPLANDPLSQMIALEFSVSGQVDNGHPPVANQSLADRPLVDLEPVLFCKDSFRMAFPPTIFELYRNLFRLRHTLRRAFILLKSKYFSQRRELSRVELNALSLMIRFVQSYDNFVFGYKASKLVHDYLQLVRSGISKNTLDLDTFLKEQEQMLNKLHGTAFVSSNPECFSNPMWAILTRMLNYARDTGDFKSTSIQICRSLKRIKRFLRAQSEGGRVLPELAAWLFGKNIKSSTIEDHGLKLCEELQKNYSTTDTPTKQRL